MNEKCKLHGLNGIKDLDCVGSYLVITNRIRHETGTSKRFNLVNEAELMVHSIHGSHRAAVVFAKKHAR